MIPNALILQFKCLEDKAFLQSLLVDKITTFLTINMMLQLYHKRKKVKVKHRKNVCLPKKLHKNLKNIALFQVL